MPGTALTLAVPAFNESAIIMGNVAELKRWMGENMPETSFEILVIDDGSTDGMGELLDWMAANDTQLRVAHHPRNMGRGRGVRTAMRESRSAYMIALDADLSYGPDHIPALLAPLTDGKADITLASPYHPDGVVENVPFTRALLSRAGNKVIAGSFQSDINTATCIVRGYTREVMDHLELINDGKDLHLELLYKAEILGFRLKDIPARLIWRDRKRGKSEKQGVRWIFDSPIFKMRHIIVSHFLFNFIAKPKLLFLGPVLIGFLVFIYGALNLTSVFFYRLFSGEAQPLRETLIDGQLTLALTAASFILAVFFLFFFFVASQAKQYFEEQYILSTRSHYLLKKISRQLDNGNGH